MLHLQKREAQSILIFLMDCQRRKHKNALLLGLKMKKSADRKSTESVERIQETYREDLWQRVDAGMRYDGYIRMFVFLLSTIPDERTFSIQKSDRSGS